MPDTVPKGIGLALSGGGFRAPLFHIGSLWRLNELGWLPRINRITSVSGGSITAAQLGLQWKALSFNAQGVAEDFVPKVVTPLRRLCGMNIDVAAGLEGLFSIGQSISDRVQAHYRAELYGDATLQDLPDDGAGPRFIIYATNLQTGSSFRFSKPYLGDYKLGLFFNPTVHLATAVAASSAFPPILSPVKLDTNPDDWKWETGAYLFDNVALRSTLYLADGGVYDNMGLEAMWDSSATVLVSDAGAPLEIQEKPGTVWHEQTLRCLDIITEQTRALRKRKLIADLKANVRGGTYWGLTTHINGYGLPDAMVTDNETTERQKKIRTRLNPFSAEEQGRLINWGYALTDAAMRKHVLPAGTAAGTWPIPDFGFKQ